ncbi:MAG TPA: hypothetical protein VK540_34635 [Polyangiaceae bacterium]|nr:hypothetical protein [Polyangiaceae bacterium]
MKAWPVCTFGLFLAGCSASSPSDPGGGDGGSRAGAGGTSGAAAAGGAAGTGTAGSGATSGTGATGGGGTGGAGTGGAGTGGAGGTGGNAGSAATGGSAGTGGGATGGAAGTGGQAGSTDAGKGSDASTDGARGGAGGGPDGSPDGNGGAGGTNPGDGGEVIWPNDISKTNSDTWISQNHDRITQLRPNVLLLNFSDTYSLAQTQTLADKHVAALKEASSSHKYKNPGAQPALAYQIAKIVMAGKANKPVSGNSINYPGLNTAAFADIIGIDDPASPGTKLTLCGLFEKGVINEVWGMVADGDGPKFDESVETKQVYSASDQKGTTMACVSNGTCVNTSVPCKVSTRIFDFNPGRGSGCHQHAMGHAWENYINRGAIPALKKSAARFLNLDLNTRLGAPFASMYSACNSNSMQLTNCVVWDSEIHARSGATAATTFDFPDMSGGCGNAHFYPNTTGTYSYDANTPDPTVQSSCENYGLKNGAGGKDLTTPFNNKMTDTLFAGILDDDCGGHGTAYLYQSFPGPGTLATNDDGTSMRNWWVYLFY